MSSTVFLFGASVRALAFSALRAGWTPVCHDLFADVDLACRAEARRLPRSDYPFGLIRFAERLRGRPWLYTGGLENHPALLRRLARHGPLWGNSAKTVRRVRNVLELRDVCERLGAPMPPVVLTPDVPADGSWLVKPLMGTGGSGIRRWRGGQVSDRVYWQRFTHGTPHAAVFVTSGGETRLLGVTRQLVGERFCHAPRFAYCGSVGPVALPRESVATLKRLGVGLAEAFGLRGLFGLDFVVDGRTLWPLEINPRYPASLESLEIALAFSGFEQHRLAFEPATDSPPETPAAPRPGEPVVGKAVLFAPHGCRIRESAPCYARHTVGTEADADRWHADVPAPGSRFEAGEPALTILQRERSLDACLAKLREAARTFARLHLRP